MPSSLRPGFKTEREAKEFLIGRILAEAERTGIEINEVERKMLYFSETGWSLPGILDVNAEFERDYDNDEYEAKSPAPFDKLKRRMPKQGEMSSRFGMMLSSS